MMNSRTIAIVLFSTLSIWADVANADVIADVKACKQEADSLKRLTCFDAITVADTTSGSSAPASSPQSTVNPVTLVSAKLWIQAKNFEKQIFHDRVALVPTFKNTSKKTVVAIAHSMTITDAFGEKVVDGEGKLDIKIPPGKTVESDTYYMWEDNPFINGEPYDKLQGPVSAGTAKAAMLVTKIIYSDGTSESF